MSGGVDSSVAAALLKERNFDVVGIHMKIWSDPRIPCTTAEDRYDAMRVAAVLDIPFQTWDFTAEYRQAVVNYMIREYAVGRTPNPDVMCNREIKFGVFLQKALAAGADYVATGHYTRLRRSDQNDESDEDDGAVRLHRAKRFTERSDSSSRLLQAIDQNKDQSYFLWTLTQEQLRHCLFPIGEYSKPEVRAMARKFNLPTAEKPDSQGICFIGEIDVRQFLKDHIPERRGLVLTSGGRVVGEHDGLPFYTIGQRHGLRISSPPSCSMLRPGFAEARLRQGERGEGGIPYYVAGKDAEKNTLIVAEGPYDGQLFRSELLATDIRWISGREPKFPLKCEARIRYRQPLQPCTVVSDQLDKGDKSAAGLDKSVTNSPSEAIHRAKRFTNLIVRFDEPQRAVTPGQSVVFYQGAEMLGGGVIVSSAEYLTARAVRMNAVTKQ